MFVNTNVAALNAWQNLDNTQSQMNNTLQQLSSGYRINTAANDPAGLAISQQMQSQINGMNQAYQNAQSGITLLQTADGAMGQVQNILQSMYSLASEAATGTENSTDLSALQQEMNQYAQEITQIANTTQFNNLNILGGTFTNQQIQIGANAGQSLTMSVAAVDAYSLGVAGEGISTATVDSFGLVGSGTTPNLTGFSATTGSNYDYLTFSTTPWTPAVSGGLAATALTIGGSYNSALSESIQIGAFTSSQTSVAFTATYNGSVYTGTATIASGVVSLTDGQGNSLTINQGAQAATAASTLTITPQSTNFYAESSTNGSISAPATNALASSVTLSGQIASGTQVTLTNSANSGELFSFETGSNVSTAFTWTTTITTGAAASVTNSNSAYTFVASSPFTMTSVATSDTYQFGVATSGSAGTGTPSSFMNATVTNGVNISTQAFASAALTTLQDAINKVSSDRATVGAYQNRLQFASSQLQTTANNLTTAQGGIMDADVAQQMSNLTKEQILQQSGVAMLAQANSMPQALLKLFP